MDKIGKPICRTEALATSRAILERAEQERLQLVGLEKTDVSESIDFLAKRMTEKLEVEIASLLQGYVSGDLLEAAQRCALIRIIGRPYETLYYEDIPLLDIYPVELEQVIEFDRVVLRCTRKTRRYDQVNAKTT